jgi:DNA-binding transcriptional MerR regulator
MDGLTKIKDVSDRYDITARTLRYYEDIGLINSKRSDSYAYRLYDETAVKRIEQILILRKLNISIKDIQCIFNASGSEVVLDVLGKKAQNIDDEVALLHELKKVVLEFIHQIEKIDFGNDSNVKLLYEKAKNIEMHITNVDYIGKPSNIGRLLEVAEKSQREPDILIVEMPPCRLVTSGLITGQTDRDDKSRRFDEMWGRLGSRIADKINPRDFMYHDEEQNKSVWLFLLEDWMTEADTEGYEIITFDGGLFASALADSWEYSEYDRVYKGIKAWLARQDCLELDERHGRHLLYHFAGPHSEQMSQLNLGRVRYFVPIKAKGER